MRGKVFGQVLAALVLGITPTYAGKRCSARTPTFRTWDHPRVCGEKRRPSSHSHTLPGSPPRVRGKAVAPLPVGYVPRITPARAGKSSMSSTSDSESGDHPRACGEKSSTGIQIQERIGSPPRVRGKVAPRPAAPAHPRITPARAGKSWRRCNWCGCGWDHPRACGEKLRMGFLRGLVPGSPPRVRGKGVSQRSPGTETGITPARAGKRALFCGL